MFRSARHVLESLCFARVKPLAAPHNIVSFVIFLVEIVASTAIEKLFICLILPSFGILFLLFKSFEGDRVVAFLTFATIFACEVLSKPIFVLFLDLVQIF